MNKRNDKEFKFLRFLCGGAFVSVLTLSSIYMPAQSMAQDIDGLSDDLSAELDFLPPQPTETILPDEEIEAFSLEETKIESMAEEKSMMADKEVNEVIEGLNILSAPPSPSAVVAEPVAPLVEAVEPAPISTNNNSISVAEPQAVAVPHSGTYYDSSSIGLDSVLGDSSVPRKVDPRYEPGQKYITVERGAGPNSSQAMLVSGNRALKLGRYTSAMEIFEKLRKRNPKDRAVLLGLAVAQQNSGLTESAIGTYERILSLDPDNKNALINLMGLIKQSNPTSALSRLRRLQDRFPHDAGVAAQIGLVSAEIGNFKDAVRYLGVAASIEPSNASHLYNMAVVTDRAGAHQDAVSLYEKALELDVVHGASRSVPRDQIYDRLAQLRRL